MNIVPIIKHDKLTGGTEGFRAFIAGKTRSGKSVLARKLLSVFYKTGFPSIVIIDIKRTFNFPGTICTSYAEIEANQTERVLIYRPSVDDTPKEITDTLNKIFRFILHRGMTILYIDEMYALSEDGYNYPPKLHTLYTMGASSGISIIACTQRPVSLPLVAFTESEWFYCFQLNNPDDRKRIASQTCPKTLIKAEGHNFWFFSAENSAESEYTCVSL